MELFLDNLLEVVVAVNGFLWNFLLLFILCGVGIYYTFKLKFIQVRKFGEGFRLVFGNLISYYYSSYVELGYTTHSN